ncbi:hypothetical protein GQ44DRAFT_636880, partial [Phaeosphaeriaceae sp. PMI808]
TYFIYKYYYYYKILYTYLDIIKLISNIINYLILKLLGYSFNRKGKLTIVILPNS